MKKKTTKTVSLRNDTVDKLNELSALMGVPMSSVIDFAIEVYYIKKTEGYSEN
jgi:hypothetical protein